MSPAGCRCPWRMPTPARPWSPRARPWPRPASSSGCHALRRRGRRCVAGHDRRRPARRRAVAGLQVDVVGHRVAVGIAAAPAQVDVHALVRGAVGRRCCPGGAGRRSVRMETLPAGRYGSGVVTGTGVDIEIVRPGAPVVLKTVGWWQVVAPTGLAVPRVEQLQLHVLAGVADKRR